ncbi:hypothetical protein BGZ70_004428 [Mortierella alpina]|uniref:Uncharacterized protein n=1 Tax=Mortierella alpina TaxID=64518 RepID=A0A9P6J9S0_MORAP|nr:hypothetical protein BGZ70_004428 [Mortierella alpina]
MAQTYSPFPEAKLTDLAASAQETKVVISEKNEQSLKDLAFGSLAGVAGKFVEFPFDTVKVRLQTQPLDRPIFKGPYDCFRQTVRNEGFLGLYNGLSSPLVGAMLENAVLFVGYRRAQDLLREFVAVPDQQSGAAAPLSIPMLCLSGGISGVFASMVLTPVELVKCKLQVQQIGHLYTKKDPKTAPLCPRRRFTTGGGAAWFGSYEALCRLLISREQLTAAPGKIVTQADLSAPQLMLAGAIAGMAYNFILFPADCIKSHMQTQDVLRSHQRSPVSGAAVVGQGFWATGKEIFRSEGLRGLYRGCGITVARSAPSSAIIFMTYYYLDFDQDG